MLGPGCGWLTASAASARGVVAGRLDRDGEATLVIAAIGTDVMRLLELVAVRALLERRDADGEVRAALALAGMRDASLGYTHEVGGSFGWSRGARTAWAGRDAGSAVGEVVRIDGGV
jgi:hypothetical protein